MFTIFAKVIVWAYIIKTATMKVFKVGKWWGRIERRREEIDERESKENSDE